MIQIDKQHLELIKRIIKEETNIDFFVFGSRAKGDSVKFSDLDLAYKGDLDRSSLLKIKTKLAESNLPFTVDIVNLNECDESFKELIQKDLKGL
jgi:predicted nucleotidyltransferase